MKHDYRETCDSRLLMHLYCILAAAFTASGSVEKGGGLTSYSRFVQFSFRTHACKSLSYKGKLYRIKNRTIVHDPNYI